MRPITVNIPEACRVSGISRSSIYRLRARGKIKIHRIGGRAVVRVDDLDALTAPPPTDRQDDQAAK